MAERIPELYVDDQAVSRPDLWVVPSLDEDHEARVDLDTAHSADVLVDVVIDVDGQPRPLCINISRGTLGNDQPIRSYFDRFENIRRNSEGRLIGDFGRAELLADTALAIAERQAGL